MTSRRLCAALFATVFVCAQSSKPTLFLIGDSTVRNGRGVGANGQWGWGDMIAPYFNLEKIEIANRAIGGRSSRTFFTEGRWQAVLDQLKSGDFVMMQFGHNDGGPLDDKDRARGSLRGIGDETREIDNPITGKHDIVHTFGWYLRQFIEGTRGKGATPVMCSLIPRKIWKGGRIVRDSASHQAWAAAVAEAEGVAFLDLNERIARRYDEMGREKVEALFADEHTHTSRAGAEINAEEVIAALKALVKNPLQQFLR
jgi:lysophospholipase L1-like esterase